MMKSMMGVRQSDSMTCTSCHSAGTKSGLVGEGGSSANVTVGLLRA
jgi:hypothetical protein